VDETPTIEMTPVVSSQIAAIGHDPDTNTLAIRFPDKGDRPGSLYHYANFTAEDFERFSAAESKGSFLIREIKPNAAKWPYTKVA
jgi:hypothetical protein